MANNFSTNLQKILDENNLSRYRFAKELGCHTSSVSNWIDDGMKPQQAMLEKIGFMFGYEPGSLLTPEPVRLPDNFKTIDDESLNKNISAAEAEYKNTQNAVFMKRQFVELLRKNDALQQELISLDQEYDSFADKVSGRLSEIYLRSNTQNLSHDEMEIIEAYRKADDWKKNAARKILDLPLCN